MEDVEVYRINVGCVYVGMEHDFLRLCLGVFGFRLRFLFGDVGHLALNHEDALSHYGVKFHILYDLCTFELGYMPCSLRNAPYTRAHGHGQHLISYVPQ